MAGLDGSWKVGLTFINVILVVDTFEVEVGLPSHSFYHNLIIIYNMYL